MLLRIQLSFQIVLIQHGVVGHISKKNKRLVEKKEEAGSVNIVFFRLHKNQNVKLYGSKNLEEGAGTENMYSIHQLRCLCCQIPDVFKMLLLSEYQFDLL